MEDFMSAADYSVIERQEFYYRETTHPDWTLYIVISGSFCCEFDGKEEVLEKGDLYFIPPSAHFKRHVIEPLRVHFFRFRTEGQSPPFPLPVGKYRPKSSTRLQGTLQMLQGLTDLEAGTRDAFLRHLLQDILFQIQYESVCAPHLHQIADPLVENVIDYLKQHFAQKLNMRNVAEHFAISPSGLILKFRRTTGQLPMRHLIGIRIEQAKRLLVNSTLSLSKIAEQTGFDNCYYFSNSFKREVGISPSQYRKAYTI